MPPFGLDCPICLDTSSEWVAFRCGHGVCSSCLRVSVSNLAPLHPYKCPLCREEVPGGTYWPVVPLRQPEGPPAGKGTSPTCSSVEVPCRATLFSEGHGLPFISSLFLWSFFFQCACSVHPMAGVFYVICSDASSGAWPPLFTDRSVFLWVWVWVCIVFLYHPLSLCAGLLSYAAWLWTWTYWMDSGAHEGPTGYLPPTLSTREERFIVVTLVFSLVSSYCIKSTVVRAVTSILSPGGG